MVLLERPVRFDEVDAAGLVFFAHYAAFAHEAMERLFDEHVAGGYVALITERRIGLPAVKLECDYTAPLRYGDVATIEAQVAHLGNKSAVLAYRIARKADGVRCAGLRHTVVITDLEAMRSMAMPADVRQALQAHCAQSK